MPESAKKKQPNPRPVTSLVPRPRPKNRERGLVALPYFCHFEPIRLQIWNHAERDLITCALGQKCWLCNVASSPWWRLVCLLARLQEIGGRSKSESAVYPYRLSKQIPCSSARYQNLCIDSVILQHRLFNSYFFYLKYKQANLTFFTMTLGSISQLFGTKLILLRRCNCNYVIGIRCCELGAPLKSRVGLNSSFHLILAHKSA